MKELIDNLGKHSVKDMLPIILLIIILPIIGTLSRTFSTYMISRAGQTIAASLRIKVLSNLLRQSMEYYDNKKVGEIVANLRSDLGQILGTIVNGIPDVFSNSLLTISILYIIFKIDWGLALIGIILFPVFFIPVKFAGNKAQKLGESVVELLSKGLIVKLNATPKNS